MICQIIKNNPAAGMKITANNSLSTVGTKTKAMQYAKSNALAKIPTYGVTRLNSLLLSMTTEIIIPATAMNNKLLKDDSFNHDERLKKDQDTNKLGAPGPPRW